MSKIEKQPEVKETPKKESEAHKAFEILIERYAKQNPIKYELKKKELEAKLAKL